MEYEYIMIRMGAKLQMCKNVFKNLLEEVSETNRIQIMMQFDLETRQQDIVLSRSSHF